MTTRRARRNSEEAVDARVGRNLKLGALLALLLGLAFLLGLTAYYLITFGTTIGVDVSGPPTYSRSIYGSAGIGAIGAPMGVDVDDDGNVYVVDTTSRRIQVFDSSGTLKARFPRERTGQQLINPLYVAVSPKKEVYVSDRGAGKLFIFSSTGRFLREFKPKGRTDLVWSPVGLHFDRSGNLFVTDLATQSIRAFDESGKLVGTIGRAGSAPGQFQFPNGIATDDKRIYVTDSNNGRVQVFDRKSGTLAFTFPAGSLPRGIALDGRGRIFVVDTLDHTIRVHSAQDGKFLFFFAELGQGEGQFLFPNGIAFDGDDRMYVTDRENNRVTMWEYR